MTKPKNFDVITHKGANEEITNLLSNTVLGTPGKLRYRQLETQQNLQRLQNLEFIQIKKGKRAIGTAGFIRRNLSYQSGFITGLYVRYLSVMNVLGARKKQAQPSANNKPKRSSLRTEIFGLFNYHLDEQISSDGCYYAYVEKDNILSKSLCESFGFRATRQIKTLLFSRFNPKVKRNAHRIDKQNISEFKAQLQSFYSEHDLFFVDDLELKGQCFAVHHNNAMVAGVRAFPVEWEIVELAGFKGFLLTKVLPKIPYLKRLFNAEKLKFIAFDNIWYQAGFEQELPTLFSHICKHYNHHMGMIWLDGEDGTTSYLQSKGALGFLNRINGAVTAYLMIRGKGSAQQASFDKPVFVSAIDMT